MRNDERCESCTFSGNQLQGDGHYEYRCRKRAPGPDGWPKVRPTDVCGDFRDIGDPFQSKVKTYKITVMEIPE